MGELGTEMVRVGEEGTIGDCGRGEIMYVGITKRCKGRGEDFELNLERSPLSVNESSKGVSTRTRKNGGAKAQNSQRMLPSMRLTMKVEKIVPNGKAPLDGSESDCSVGTHL